MSFEPIQVDMEVAESSQSFDMEVADQIIVNPVVSSYVKLGEKEFEINQTSTSATHIGSFYVDTASDLWTSAKMILVIVRDKAGKRAGYFLGTDSFFANPNPANGSATTNVTSAARLIYTYSSGNEFGASALSTAYGVYAYDINNEGRIRIYARYNATTSLTINGTFLCEVWALEYPSGSPLV